jgi:putative ABC transport system permease protein
MSGTETGPFLDIPWLLVAAIVLALPLLTAAVVGLSARSRLPLVARLD